MSTNDEIPGLGGLDERLRQNPKVALERMPLSSEDIFLWSRADGHTSLREILLMSGLPRDKAVGILQRLRDFGALLRPGESPEDVAAAARQRMRPELRGEIVVAKSQAPARSAPTPAAAPAPAATASAKAAATIDSSALGTLSEDEREALAEDVEISDKRRVRIVEMRRKLDGDDYFALLGVAEDADARTIRRAYFALSKEFHPDRYYGRHTGRFGPWLSAIFAQIKSAYEVLSNDSKRADYQRRRSGGGGRSQSKAEYASDLYDRACANQAKAPQQALTLFSAAIRLDPQVRYLSRGAHCALDAGDSKQALLWAQLAAHQEPENPSMLRLLADAQEAGGDLVAAAATLALALGLKTENDALSMAMREALERVRARLDD